MNNEKLELAGVNLKTLSERLMGSEALMKKLFVKLAEDDTMDLLVAAAEQKDAKEGALLSHRMKGMCGNLSRDRLYELFSEQMQYFRSEKEEEAFAMMDEIDKTYREALVYVRDWLEQ